MWTILYACEIYHNNLIKSVKRETLICWSEWMIGLSFKREWYVAIQAYEEFEANLEHFVWQEATRYNHGVSHNWVIKHLLSPRLLRRVCFGGWRNRSCPKTRTILILGSFMTPVLTIRKTIWARQFWALRPS